MSTRIFAGLVIVVCLMPGIRVAQAQNSAPPRRTLLLAPLRTRRPPSPPTAYKIGPQDMLRIDVWKEPDISRLVPFGPMAKSPCLC